MGKTWWGYFNSFLILAFSAVLGSGLSACQLQPGFESNGVGFTGVGGESAPVPSKTGGGNNGGVDPPITPTEYWDSEPEMPATPYLHMECNHHSSSNSSYRVVLISKSDTSRLTATLYELPHNATREKVVYTGEVRSLQSSQFNGYLNFNAKDANGLAKFYLRVQDPALNANPLQSEDTQFGYYSQGKADGNPSLSRDVVCTADWSATLEAAR